MRIAALSLALALAASAPVAASELSIEPTVPGDEYRFVLAIPEDDGNIAGGQELYTDVLHVEGDALGTRRGDAIDLDGLLFRLGDPGQYTITRSISYMGAGPDMLHLPDGRDVAIGLFLYDEVPPPHGELPAFDDPEIDGVHPHASWFFSHWNAAWKAWWEDTRFNPGCVTIGLGGEATRTLAPLPEGLGCLVLDIRGPLDPEESFSALAGLPHLEILVLRVLDDAHARFDASVLENAHSLRLLRLEGLAELRSLASLARQGGLRSLEIDSKHPTDLTEVGALVQLERLVVRAPASGYSALSGLRGLVEVDIFETEFEEIGFLAGSRRLQFVDLAGTRVQELAPLALAGELRHLALADTRVTDLSPLNGLAELEVLDVSSTPLEAIPELSLPSLRSLDLDGCPVSGASVEAFAARHPECQITPRAPARGGKTNEVRD